jgi:hypothetical protein
VFIQVILNRIRKHTVGNGIGERHSMLEMAVLDGKYDAEHV